MAVMLKSLSFKTNIVDSNIQTDLQSLEADIQKIESMVSKDATSTEESKILFDLLKRSFEEAKKRKL